MLSMTDPVKTDSDGVMRTAAELFSSMGEYRRMLAGQRFHDRAGFTTNKGRGLSKSRRRMAKASRRRNRV